MNLLIRQMLIRKRWRQQHFQSAGNKHLQSSPELNRDNWLGSMQLNSQNSALQQPSADSYWKSKLTRDMKTLQKSTRLRLKTSSRINLQSTASIRSLALMKGIIEWTFLTEKLVFLDLMVSYCSLILPEWCRIVQLPGACNPSGK